MAAAPTWTRPTRRPAPSVGLADKRDRLQLRVGRVARQHDGAFRYGGGRHGHHHPAVAAKHVGPRVAGARHAHGKALAKDVAHNGHNPGDGGGHKRQGGDGDLRGRPVAPPLISVLHRYGRPVCLDDARHGGI